MSDLKLYWVWRRMIKSTNSPSYKDYKNYGGRGIKICDEWLHNFKSFHKWAIANGYSEGLQIDRVDNNGDYEPSNCRWTTSQVQNNNKRNNINIEYNGETKTLGEWSKFLDIEYHILYDRLYKYHWEIDKVFTTKTHIPPNSKKIFVSNEMYNIKIEFESIVEVEKFFNKNRGWIHYNKSKNNGKFEYEGWVIL